MNRQEIKMRLEKALRTTIKSAEWAFLEDRGLIHDYEINGDWPELRRGVEDNLKAIREFRENDLREQAGELEVAPAGDGADYQPEPAPVDLGDRALARYNALGALNHLRSGGSAPPRATIDRTFIPRGGVDGTVPQWVIVLAVEAWMPAEEVARNFRAAQRSLMAAEQPRTQARAFEVAAFVWQVEAHYGRRPSWPEMCELWNDYPMTEPFEDDWRSFRRNFERGAKATLPRYKATDEEITRQVREASDRGEAAAFDLWVSQVLAATVQRDHGR